MYSLIFGGDSQPILVPESVQNKEHFYSKWLREI